MNLRGSSRFCFAVIAVAFLVLPITAYALQFTDITDVAGVGDRGHGKGVAFADVDGDGDLDLYVSNKGGENALFLNDGTGTFAPAPREAGDRLDDSGMSMGSCFGDIDNDVTRTFTSSRAAVTRSRPTGFWSTRTDVLWI
jgi:hypothetical protein